MCSVISSMLSTMLLFRFEGHKTTTRKRPGDRLFSVCSS
jgi:hypothetical protein